jgi:hypothetical protein
MNANDFRTLALSLPEATECSHMDHPDFRVRGKIFATLGPLEDWAMVKLKPQEQSSFVRHWPKVFQPFNGAWGKRGCTRIVLDLADEATVRQALLAAWCNIAPKKLVQEQHGST